MSFCLIKPLADKFKQALKDGTIDPEKLGDMSSEDRHAFFAKILNEDVAGKVNALFEQKQLLKDTQQGMINWAKQVSGIKEDVRRDLISRIEKMDERILNPEEGKAFMQELASRRIGTEVTIEEARTISELSKNLKKAKENFTNNPMGYGVARVEMENFINDIKRENNKTTLEDFKRKPIGTLGSSVSKLAGIAKSLKATLDVSAFMRQGLKAMILHPKEWAAGVQDSMIDVFDTLKAKTSNDEVMDAVRADIYSRQNSMDGAYKRMKLDVGTGEEAYPSSLPEKIPALGRVFKASEVAYQGFLTRLRADIADKYIDLAMKNGVDLKDMRQAEALGSLVNSLTGRGSLGPAEVAGKVVNVTFFSPKSLKANIDFLTAHQMEGVFAKGERTSTPFTRRVAALNLLKVLGTTAAVLAVAKALWPNSVETDPRSSDFGKIRIGDTRFDVTGGMGSLVTLVSREMTQSSKSSITDAVKPLGTGFGQTSGWDVLVNFAENKLSPASAFVKDLLKQSDSQGKPLTLGGELANTFAPLPITNYVELKNNPHSAPLLLALIADALGISTNTYANANAKSNIIPQDKRISNDDLISEVMTYAQAIGTDPETAFNRIFTGQKIVRVSNGAVIVQRMSLKDSTEVKKKGKGNNPSMKLDHTVPLEIGGSNDENNLKLVPTSVWQSYTAVEDHFGKLLKEGKISKSDAQKWIVDFKEGRLSRSNALSK